MRRLLLLAPVLLLSPHIAAAQAPAAQTINLYSFGYRPAPIVLAAGKPVTLTFVNASSKGHDFTAPAFFRSARILTGNAAKGEVELGGGESRSVTLVPAAGTYEAHCGHPFHSMMGMHTQIVVR